MWRALVLLAVVWLFAEPTAALAAPASEEGAEAIRLALNSVGETCSRPPPGVSGEEYSLRRLFYKNALDAEPQEWHDGGAIQTFSGETGTGLAVWEPGAARAYLLNGDWAMSYLESGGPSRIGYPTNQLPSNDAGCFQSSGEIEFSRAMTLTGSLETGYHFVYGAIRESWMTMDWRWQNGNAGYINLADRPRAMTPEFTPTEDQYYLGEGAFCGWSERQQNFALPLRGGEVVFFIFCSNPDGSRWELLDLKGGGEFEVVALQQALDLSTGDVIGLGGVGVGVGGALIGAGFLLGPIAAGVGVGIAVASGVATYVIVV